MIDLSITKDSDWIKSREVVWSSLEEDFKEGLRKKELQELKTYFFSGVFPGQRDFADRAYFKWFPLQTAEGWDYVFEYLVKHEKVFEDSFYAALGDLTGSGLFPEQELAMWDYFAGDKFRQEVTSRVPVGKEGKMVSFSVDREKIGSLVCGSVNSWLKGGYSNNPKWIKRSDYYFSFIENLKDEEFIPNDRGSPVSNGAYFVKALMSHMYSFNPAQNMDEEGIKVRIEFLQSARARLAKMDMPPRMKDLWKQFEL